MKLLITGATGYLAANFINYCLEQNIFFDKFSQITLVDRTLKSSRLTSKNKFKLVQSTIMDFKDYDFDYVIHAAYTKNLSQEIDFINHLKQSYFVFLSSAAVYGNQEQFPIEPSASCKPINDYGCIKLGLENYIIENLNNYLILRIANPYGKEFESKGFHAIVDSKLASSDQVEITLNSDLPQQVIRDFVSIRDFTSQMYDAIGQKGIVNISSGKGLTLESFVQMLNDFKYLGRKQIKFIYSGLNPEEITKSILKPYEVYFPGNWL